MGLLVQAGEHPEGRTGRHRLGGVDEARTRQGVEVVAEPAQLTGLLDGSQQRGPEGEGEQQHCEEDHAGEERSRMSRARQSAAPAR